MHRVRNDERDKLDEVSAWQVQAQAPFLAYMDVFWMLMLVALMAVPPAMTLRKVKLGGRRLRWGTDGQESAMSRHFAGLFAVLGSIAMVLVIPGEHESDDSARRGRSSVM